MSVINGTAAADVLNGGADADVIYGLDGPDTLVGGGGADTLFGGDGADFLTVTAGVASGAIGMIDGGPGADVLDLTQAAGAISTVTGAALRFNIGGQLFDVSNVETFAVGDQGSNLSFAGYVPQAGPGVVVYGGAARDILFGSSANDTLFGGGGDDFINPGNGTDVVYGGIGDDKIFASVAETIYGGDGDDAVFVTGGSSSKVGLIDGGAGNNVLQLAAGFDVDLQLGGGIANFSQFTIANFESVTLATGAPSGDVVAARGDGAANLLQVASDGDFGGPASLDGRGGNDTLIGGVGADSLYGGDGDDILSGKGGSNLLDGGAGYDVANVARTFASSAVTYADGQIIVAGANGADSLSGIDRVAFADQSFDVGADGRLILTPGTTLAGSTGADNLAGGGGNDTLSGLAGADILTGGPGSDSLDGGTGVDTAQYGGFEHDYQVSVYAAAGFVAGGQEGGRDDLMSLEILSFLDGKLSFDTGGVAAQIVRLYDSFLGRAPDAAGFNSYLNFIASGHSLQDMAANAAASAEFHDATASLTDSQYITYVYEHSLHREPDAYGMQQYLDALHSGALTRTSLIVQAAESPEHVALTAPIVAEGLWIPNEHVEGLELLYDAAVQRQPDSAGLTGYGALLDGGATFRQVANQMSNSAEFLAAHGGQSDAEYVDSLYVAEVGRHADSAGLAAYTAELANGHTRGDILYETAMSQEHQSHVLSFYDPLLAYE